MRECDLVGQLSEEMSNACFGDQRLTNRLSRLTDRLVARPSDSLPIALGSEAELEGAYRFFDNARVTPEKILAPHVEATIARCQSRRTLALHDITQFAFGEESKREGLGPLRGTNGLGFLTHFTLAVAADDTREPLGVLSMAAFVRKVGGKGKRAKSVIRDDTDNERRHWKQQALAVAAMVPDAIHVMDREADSFALFHALKDHHFVIRSGHDRVLELPERPHISDWLSKASVRLMRTVQLSRRKGLTPTQKRSHPNRAERTANLVARATTVPLQRPAWLGTAIPKSLQINVVEVLEPTPPDGEPPVSWVLLTNLPVGTPEEIAFVIDCYRARWVIEEFFKALKTGCQIEERQLETLPRLLNVLATLAPVAWQLLLLRHLSRYRPDTPADQVLSTDQLGALRAFSKHPLPKRPTVEDAMLCVAQLGGHLKRNGEPGWQVLGRGFHDLLLYTRGWSARADGSRKM